MEGNPEDINKENDPNNNNVENSKDGVNTEDNDNNNETVESKNENEKNPDGKVLKESEHEKEDKEVDDPPLPVYGNSEADLTEDRIVPDDDDESTISADTTKQKNHTGKRKKKRTVRTKNKKQKLNSSKDSIVNETTLLPSTSSTVEEHLALTIVSKAHKVDQLSSESIGCVQEAKSRGKHSKKYKKNKNKYANLAEELKSLSETLSGFIKDFGNFQEYVVSKLVSNDENWRQLKSVEHVSVEDPVNLNDIMRPPPVGFTRVDDNTIHLGRGVWIPRATYDNDVYNAGASTSMFVKNIAVSVFGTEYLKSHSVKGKSSNKTKSIPRPAIDSTRALAIKDIFEHYLKNEKKLSGQALSEEVDMYEEYIRQKISDLIRPPRKPKEQNKDEKANEKVVGKKKPLKPNMKNPESEYKNKNTDKNKQTKKDRNSGGKKKQKEENTKSSSESSDCSSSTSDESSSSSEEPTTDQESRE